MQYPEPLRPPRVRVLLFGRPLGIRTNPRVWPLLRPYPANPAAALMAFARARSQPGPVAICLLRPAGTPFRVCRSCVSATESG